MTIRYEIRGATQDDHEGLSELARFLDSVNLPNDSSAIRDIVETSDRSFSGAIGDPRRREYVFVLRDLSANRAVGTSMVIGQLGRKDAPYIYFDVLEEEKYSPSLDKHFVHQVLSIGYSFNGPTEIGGLVMHPSYRRAPERLGMLISYVRFLWITMHRHDFQDELLAELLPPLEPDGKSYLWEAVGRRFTHMEYREADRLSKKNKEFIRSLFPDGDIYASLLGHEAREVIGKVGPQTRGVEKLLRRIGFRYADRVDPFDGGPHFVADTDEVRLVKRSVRRRARVGEPKGTERVLIAVEHDARPWFQAISDTVDLVDDYAVISRESAAHLAVSDDDELWALPLE